MFCFRNQSRPVRNRTGANRAQKPGVRKMCRLQPVFAFPENKDSNKKPGMKTGPSLTGNCPEREKAGRFTVRCLRGSPRT